MKRGQVQEPWSNIHNIQYNLVKQKWSTSMGYLLFHSQDLVQRTLIQFYKTKRWQPLSVFRSYLSNLACCSLNDRADEIRRSLWSLEHMSLSLEIDAESGRVQHSVGNAGVVK